MPSQRDYPTRLHHHPHRRLPQDVCSARELNR
ncbi:hypothetical protein LINPERPRIM_LOCUS5508 [Linum perenne]